MGPSADIDHSHIDSGHGRLVAKSCKAGDDQAGEFDWFNCLLGRMLLRRL
jgi:hypothetical protein